MRCLLRIPLALLLLICPAASVGVVSANEVTSRPTAERVARPFTLKDTAGKNWSLADCKDSKAIVVLFLGTECPINNQYLPRLAELHEQYAPKGVVFVGINSNVHDTNVRIEAHAKANKIPFPVLKDSGNVVADDLGARRTPEAFVLSPTGRILYQGRIDDQIGIGYRRKAPTRQELVEALNEVLAGKPVTTPTTEVAGCLIARARKPSRTGTVTWTGQVASIVQQRCQECHRPGQVAPMSLLSYEDVSSWQEMIREVVSERRMPPWHADPAHGQFSNDRSLTHSERETLLKWIEEGCPRGEGKEPAPKTWPSNWSIGKPDVVFEMPQTFTVPAEAGPRGVPYKYFLVPTNFDEDRWVQAAEARPGAREVVHHIIIYVADRRFLSRKLGGLGQTSPEGRIGQGRFDGIGNGFLTAYAPGDMPLILEPGQAKKLPKGALLIFQMHYTPDGVEREDRSSVGLIFAKQPPKFEVRTRGIAQQLLMIPPGDPNYRATSRTTFERDVELLSMMPHMHLRGKDFKYEAVFPDGKRQTLLSVPRYDFNWQSTYRLKEPLRLPAGTRIECVAHFDNSANNPNNPDPRKRVFWGDQTWEEMMIGFVDYAVSLESKATNK
jgi:peroxiredoxin